MIDLDPTTAVWDSAVAIAAWAAASSPPESGTAGVAAVVDSGVLSETTSVGLGEPPFEHPARIVAAPTAITTANVRMVRGFMGRC